jgi:hypothetical protein
MAVGTGFIIFISILFHELGHYVYWKYNINKNVKFRDLNVVGSYIKGEVSQRQLYEYYFAGIVFGLIPILIFFGYSFIFSTLILIMYVAGCSSDIKQIWHIVK